MTSKGYMWRSIDYYLLLITPTITIHSVYIVYRDYIEVLGVATSFKESIDPSIVSCHQSTYIVIDLVRIKLY